MPANECLDFSRH